MNISSMSLNKDAFQHSIPNNLEIDKKVTYGLTGEIGVVFSSQVINLKIGVEIIKPNKISNLSIKDTNDNTAFSLTSEVLVYVPTIGVEIIFFKKHQSRFFWEINGGPATVTLNNEYSSIDSSYGISDFIEKAEGTVYTINSAFSYEINFFDTSTSIFSLGYRHLIIEKLKHQASYTSFIGTHQKGDYVLNSDDSYRKLNLSGIFFSLSFRIYL